MLDLYNNQYTSDILLKNIYALNLIDILKTQKLSMFFIVKYILNNKYQLTKEEENITPKMVIYYQPHIDLHNLCMLLVSYHYNTDENSERDGFYFDDYLE
jgi:hypothetical protein